jgi:hypothetical protein
MTVFLIYNKCTTKQGHAWEHKIQVDNAMVSPQISNCLMMAHMQPKHVAKLEEKHYVKQKYILKYFDKHY